MEKEYGVWIKQRPSFILVEIRQLRSDGEGYLETVARQLRAKGVEQARAWIDKKLDPVWVEPDRFTPAGVLGYALIRMTPAALMAA